jgi:RNA polymerase sigma-70 factor (ECF subfamily)
MAAKNNKQAAPDESDFHQAVSRGGDQWYAACLRITRSPELAGDAVQDALLNAWRKRRQFEGGAALETWIHRIAVNSALSLLRSQHPERWAALDMDVTDEAPTPEAHQQDRELDQELQQAMQSLSEAERVCFILKHLEQWRLQEIARDLNTSTGTVKQAVFRAVKKLRVSMTDLRSAK